MRLFNGNTDRIISVKEEERVHDVIGPGPNLFPRAYAKIIARVERPHIIYELCTTGTELFETYIIQHSSREEDCFPKTQDRSR